VKSKIENLKPLDILGNGDCSSDREILTAIRKRWRQKLGYCSIFAAVPAIFASHVPNAHSDEAKKTEASVADRTVRILERLSMNSDRALLKRQSKYLLPHQRGSFYMLAAVGGTDDCPGRVIPGGNYTAAAPYTDSGDTTGANDTVTSLPSYYYYSYDAHGPDHIYSFTLTARGPNPQITVSTTSGTYRPLIYVLQGAPAGVCPAGVGNAVSDVRALSYSSAGTATINSDQVNSLPLNVPVHLFVDSPRNDASGSGPYTVRMQDVTIGPPPGPNSIDLPEFFVRQHYLDFLAREPEQSGMEAWLGVLHNCPGGDNECLHQARLTTSGSFFGSPEFQLKGYFVFRFYKVAFGRLPTYDEIISDMQSVSRPTPAEVYAAKAAFTDAFVQRQGFVNSFGALSNSDYVAALLGRFGLSAVTAPDPAQPDAAGKVTLTSAELVGRLNAGSLTRAQVLRAVANSDQVFLLEFNSAFVAMQYYGYLRRTPEVAGYNDWLSYLNAHPQEFREMIRGFMDSTEYRARFVH
jgi:hypothetical protein